MSPAGAAVQLQPSTSSRALLDEDICVLFSALRFQEKGNLEVLLFTIQSRMRANNQRVYTPKEGVLVADINKVSGTRVDLERRSRRPGGISKCLSGPGKQETPPPTN